MFTHRAYTRLVRHVACKECFKNIRIHEIAEGKLCKIYYFILMYVSCIVYNLLCRPTNAHYVNSNVSFVKFSNMLLCIYIFFRELLFLYMLKLQNQ